MDIETEIYRVLRRHQPQYDERGPTTVCQCGVGLPATQDPAARHQTRRIMDALRAAGITL